MVPIPAPRQGSKTHHHPLISTPAGHVSNGPKIAGSEAAFIVVVILLAVIVIAASVGIYFLLRNGEPSAADRSVRRKYSIRRQGVRAHPLPIGLPGSFSEKISSLFKGRRAGTGAGWMPARDDDHENLNAGGDWDTTDEPLRESDSHGDVPLAYVQQQHQGDEYLRVGSAPSRHTPLTDASMESGSHRSRSASHIDADNESAFSPESFGRDASQSALNRQPDEEWINARDTRSGADNGSGAGIPLGYSMPEPRRADSGQEIPLFAGSMPFRY